MGSSSDGDDKTGDAKNVKTDPAKAAASTIANWAKDTEVIEEPTGKRTKKVTFKKRS